MSCKVNTVIKIYKRNSSKENPSENFVLPFYMDVYSSILTNKYIIKITLNLFSLSACASVLEHELRIVVFMFIYFSTVYFCIMMLFFLLRIKDVYINKIYSFFGKVRAR